MNNSIFEHTNVDLLIAIKLTNLQKNGLPNLTMTQFKEVVKAMKWKEGQPQYLHEIVEDVFSCSAGEIVAYLSQQAIINARQHSLEDYASLLGGKNQ